MIKKIFIISLCILAFRLASCARIGSPDGGPKDSIPPVMALAKPQNKTTLFKAKKVTILFDEYIRFNNLSQQLIISPPMEKKPEIKPLSDASKKITIEFLEKLKPNTTYTINFGNSIVDNNEKNELGRFSYVFSTGELLDSLSVNGFIFDPLAEKDVEEISVMGYKNAHDSLVGNYTPDYLTNSLKSNFYSLENLSEATYTLIALEDKNNNYKYDKGLERIGFLNDSIYLNKPIDSLDFILFKEAKDFKIFRPSQTKGNQIILGYNGTKEPTLQLEGIKKDNYFISKEKAQDSLYIWFKEIPQDTVHLYVDLDTLKEHYKLLPRKLAMDSIAISSNIGGTLHPRDTFAIKTTVPVAAILNDSISLLENDSIPVDFKLISNPKEHLLQLDFERKNNTFYALKLKEYALVDFLGFHSYPKNFTFNITNPEEYGEIVLHINNPKKINLIVELRDAKKNKISQCISDSGALRFKDLIPEKYTVRIIKDLNNNKQYDNGNFALKIQPEEVINIEKVLTLRANSEINENITIE
ncbi:Ig-like domain-containing protein [Ochrovirga pacifica]|uniref:Ig-like domain-containing protein n=1 Tax=Ochrovirga pacifica TaxID=1042376 RepID=UPI0002558E49|nr:Ig-like domain-containing protein [Ochrovirga pacifica]